MSSPDLWVCGDDIGRQLPLGAGLGALCAIRAVSEDGLWLEMGEVYNHDAEAVAWVSRLSAALPQPVGE